MPNFPMISENTSPSTLLLLSETNNDNTQKSAATAAKKTKLTIFLVLLLISLVCVGFYLLSPTNSLIKFPFRSSTSSKYNRKSISSMNIIGATGDSNLSSYVSSPLLEPKCLTYKERYRLCMEVQTKLKSAAEKRFFFSQFLRTDSIHPLPKEVALYRLHRIKSWSDDFWLNVCSWITETTGLPIIPVDEMMATRNDPDRRRELYEIKYPAYKKKVRDTWLFTLGGHEDSIPNEFEDFIKIHLEDELVRIFSKPLYRGGYNHGGDLAAGLFLKVNPQYEFCWIFESDTRFGGTSWHRFLTMARVAGKLNIDHTPIAPNNGRDGIGKEAHLIWFYPRMINYGYGVKQEYSGVKDPEKPVWSAPDVPPSFHALERKVWADAMQQKPAPTDPTQIVNSHLWNFRVHYRGTWNSSLARTVFNGLFIPAWGFSSVLAKKILAVGMEYNGHSNQEIMASVVAQQEGLKMTSLAGLKIPKEFLSITPKTTAVTNSLANDEINASTDRYFPFQFYFGFSRRTESAPMYVQWMNGESITDVAALYRGIHTYSFRNSDCLEDLLVHPVKL